MVHPINQLGFSRNGNVYRKSNSNEKRGMALFGGLTAVNAGIDIYKNAKDLHRFKCPLILSKSGAQTVKNATLGDKRTALIYSVIAGTLSVGINLLWGKLIGGTVDSIINDRRANDADGAEVYLLRQHAKDNQAEYTELKNTAETEEPSFETDEIENDEQDFADMVESDTDNEEVDFEPEDAHDEIIGE